MSDSVIICAIVCGTIALALFGSAVFSYLKEAGFLSLKRVENGILAEKMKADNKSLLEGKYLG